MNKFKEMLMKDFLWKLLSLAIAVILWFVVINLENPVETRNFNGVAANKKRICNNRTRPDNIKL